MSGGGGPTGEPSILDQLLDEKITAFLVKGNPGTGKSTLALELLRRSGKGTYVITRLSKENIAFQNSQVETRVIGGKEEFSVGGVDINAQDYRLAGSKTVLQMIVDKAAEKKGGLIVLDSWDSIAKELDPAERLKAEKLMVTIAQSNDLKLGLISEEPGMTTTDYLVDAVVELTSELRHGYTLRKVQVKKLRGQQIGRPVRMFTLDNGLFRICQPTRIMFPGQYVPKMYVPVKNPSHLYAVGATDYDRRLGGGFPPGAVIVLEYGEGISALYLEPYRQVLNGNFVSNGGCVVSLTPLGVAPASIPTSLRALLPRPLVDSNVRVGHYERCDDPCFFQLDSSSAESTFKKLMDVIDTLKNQEHGPSLVTVGTPTLEYVHGKDEVLGKLSALVTRIKSQGDVLILIVNDAMATKNAIIGMADSHVLFESIGDVLTVQSLRPSGPIRTIAYDYAEGYPQVSYQVMI